MKNQIIKLLPLAVFLPACNNGQSGKSKVKETAKPNILFIAVDDLKTMLGCYGDSLIKTPNIDKIAEQGTVFQNSYCQVAVCGASRASLLTGMYADHTKVWTFDSIRKHNPDVITLPQHFKNNGYRTINLGKIFDYRTVDNYYDSISWSHVFPVEESDYYPHYSKETGIATMYHYQSPSIKKRYQELKKEALAAGKDTFGYAFKHICPAVECNLEVPDDAYKDGIFSKLAVKHIDTLAKQDNPFFLAVGFHKPHLPFVAPKKYWDLYSNEDIELAQNPDFAKNAVEYAYHTSGELRGYTDEKGKPIYDILEEGKELPPAEQKKLVHAYMATVSCVDAQVGKIMNALKENDLADNTIIVFWGDHGWHLGDHNMWGKVSTFEQATHAPLIINSLESSIPKTLVPSEFVDIYPTLCELAGLPKPQFLDGESLLPVMQGKTKDDYAISQWPKGNKMGYAIRNERYRYVEWVEEGLHVNPGADLSKVADKQLFDYKKDPWEEINVANDPDYNKVKTMMAEKLHGFYKTINITRDLKDF